MRGGVAWPLLWLAVSGCEQLLGIRDVDTVGPGDGSNGSACATIPTWAGAIQHTAPGAVAIAVGNLSGAGLQDIAVANGSDLLVFANDGSGGYGTSRHLRATASPATNLLVADMNHDGRDDIVAWNGQQTPTQVAIYLQDASQVGMFAAPTTIMLTLPFPVSAGAAADLTGSGFPSLVFASGNDLVLYPSDVGAFTSGSGTTIAAATEMLLLDVDGDGFNDIAFAGGGTIAQVEFNSPSAPGTFPTKAQIGTTNDAIVVFGHYSSGSAVDVLVPSPSGSTLFDQASPREFAQAATSSLYLMGESFMAAGIDLDGDGRDDVAEPFPAQYALACSPGVFSPATTTLLPLPVTQLALFADVNGDGKPDAIGFAEMVTPGASTDTFEVALHE